MSRPPPLDSDESTLLQAALETPLSSSASDLSSQSDVYISEASSISVVSSVMSTDDSLSTNPNPAVHGKDGRQGVTPQAQATEQVPQDNGDGSDETGWETFGEKPSSKSSMVSSLDTSSWPTIEEEKDGSSSANKALQQQTSTPGLPHSTLETDSQKWEDVPSSMTSSFPSMSFPERTTTPSPVPTKVPADLPTFSTTAAIFDPSLSRRVRFSALVSSLAINMLLPFVNGVMLGFGEIFAKNVILKWFGWNPTTTNGLGTTNVGLGVHIPSERSRKTSR